MIKRIVLDSSALIAYFLAEPGAEKVKGFFSLARRRKIGITMSAVNLGETLYVVLRNLGAQGGQHFVKWLAQAPITVASADKEQALSAAHLKSQHGIHYADCFTVALAQQLHAEIATCDQDFEMVQDLVKLMWI